MNLVAVNLVESVSFFILVFAERKGGGVVAFTGIGESFFVHGQGLQVRHGNPTGFVFCRVRIFNYGLTDT